jgi:hypothetical protein
MAGDCAGCIRTAIGGESGARHPSLQPRDPAPRFEPVDNQRLAHLCGAFDAHLRASRRRWGEDQPPRGCVPVDGPRPEPTSAMALLQSLYGRRRGRSAAETLQLALVEARGALAAGQQEGPAARPALPPGAESIVLHTRRADLRGRTPNQVQYLHHILAHDITFGIGPAGTGKTFLAVACAVDALERSGGAAHRAHAAGGGGRRAAGLPARRPGAEGRSLPAAAVRRAVRPDGLRPGAPRPSRRGCSRSRRWPSCAGARSTTPS